MPDFDRLHLYFHRLDIIILFNLGQIGNQIRIWFWVPHLDNPLPKLLYQQALCPTEINCQSDGVAELPKIFVLTFVQTLFDLMQQLSHNLFSMIAFSSTLLGTSSAASEYTKQVSGVIFLPWRYHNFVFKVKKVFVFRTKQKNVSHSRDVCY